MSSDNISLNSSYSNFSSSECDIDPFNASLQLFIVVVNTLHPIVLKKLRNDSDTLYLQILFIVLIHDIIVSFMISLSHVFCVYQWIQIKQACMADLVKSLWMSTGILQYVIGLVAMASCYRYIAICKPFRYDNNRFLSKPFRSLLIILIINMPIYVVLRGCGTICSRNCLSEYEVVSTPSSSTPVYLS